MGLRQVKGFSCVSCGARLRPSASVCPECKELGLLQIAYDLADAARSLDRAALDRREMWMWRYRELLPLDELAEIPSLQVGMTPVYGAPRLGAWAGISGLWLKDEGRSPSGTVEDRASALVAVQAREAGRKVLAVASAGPAGASLSCFAAAMDLRTVVFAPLDADPADLALASQFGATVLSVDGPAADARELCAQACRSLRWFDCSELASPYPLEGKKTAGHEIAEQLCERMPEWVVVTADASGETLCAVCLGLKEMRELKLVKSVSRLLAVARPGQASLLSGRSEDPAWRRAARALRESEGAVATVSDEVLDEATNQAARLSALTVDADGARAIAGLKAAVAEGAVESGQTALVLVNGRSRQARRAGPVIEVGRELAKVEEAAKGAALTGEA